MTAEEKEEVRHLKEACDVKNVKYRSTFELAKYCLVCSSVKDPKKRRAEAFSRLKKRRAFEEKHKLDDINLLEAVESMEENMPNWSVPCGKIDGKWCVGYTSQTANPSFMNSNFQILCKVEMNRFDLAASDLEEARRGFYIIGTGKNLKGNPLKAARTAINLRVLFDKMHANRVKGIFYELPKSLAFLGNMILNVLPSKVKERVCVGKNLEEMRIHTDFKEEYEQNVHEELGGLYSKSLYDWFKERLLHQSEADKRVEL